MLIKTHRDNWSPLTSIAIGAGVTIYRERFKDVAVNLDDPAVVAELLAASARKAIEVDASAREELEAHGLTVTGTGAIVELKMIAPRGVVAGEQLAEGNLPPGAVGEPIAAPGPDGGDEGDDDQGDDDEGDDDEGDDDELAELDQVDDPGRPAHEDPPAAAGRGARAGRRKGKGKGKGKAGGRA